MSHSVQPKQETIADSVITIHRNENLIIIITFMFFIFLKYFFLLESVPLTPRCLGDVTPLAIRSSATAIKSSYASCL